ncbi:sulfide/dihydroorotate dehydrogenase-like FAD/NAD-binding protein [Candidatus Woesearchaeota archaeon]|nr:sulfide/dihydroorotate dehydrogenase-like FAD/NAD-binding protein [Candidatus Woesearchaeota archaeon]
MVEKETLNEGTVLLRVKAPRIAAHAQAGQFVVLRIREKGERIPLTLADWDEETITLVFQPVGKTTQDLAKMLPGGSIRDVLGPLGNPAEISKVGTVVLVGGGLGIAPLFPQARAFKEAGNRVVCVIGVRTKGLLFWEDRFKGYAELVVCTEDGSHGMKGLVTDGLKRVMRERKVDRVVAIGPPVMMKFVSLATREAMIPTVVSINSIMVDGIGMCGGCRVPLTTKEIRFSCADGPEFDGHIVDWDALLVRNRMYEDEEKACRCT